jgi:hypothetical protein
MEFVIILLLIVVIILVLTSRNDAQTRISILQSKIDSLITEVKKQREAAPVIRKVEEEKKSVSEQPVIIPSVTQQPKPEVIPEIKVNPPIEEVKPPVVTEPINRPPVALSNKPLPKKPGFFERNPDLEKFIGENLANKIGIGVLVLGIGYFV